MILYNCIKTVNTVVRKGEYMISVNFRDARPIYEQIKDDFKKLIISGALSKDD